MCKIKITDMLYTLIKTSLITLIFSFGIANSELSNSTNSTIKKDKPIVQEVNLNDNKDVIIQTMDGCTASCCSNRAPLEEIKSSKAKVKKADKRKKVGWFSRQN